MNFNSLEFLLLFLPVTFIAFYTVPIRLRMFTLAAASLIFYGVSGLIVLIAFILSIFWAYFTAFLIGRWSKLAAVLIAISVPSFFLIMFKYLELILNTMHATPETRAYFWFFSSVLLPAGISFYTFELISYAIDVADRKIDAEHRLQRFRRIRDVFPASYRWTNHAIRSVT